MDSEKQILDKMLFCPENTQHVQHEHIEHEA